jgi:uncharacterized membrane protein
MDALTNLCSAFGLSGAAGLNAYIPLLVVSIMQNQHKIALAKQYEFMGQWWFIAILVVLLIIELVVDKIPGADHVNDIIHTAIRPTAGAIIFAAEGGNISWVHPGVWIALGLLTSGGVHAAKAIARPMVNVSSAGIAAPVVSAVENFVSTILSIVAVLVPILGVLLMGVFGWMLYKIFRQFFGRRVQPALEPVIVTAVPLPTPPALSSPSQKEGQPANGASGV